MRHLSGEKTGSKLGLLINSCILFFLFFSSLSFSQIPINGFCSLKSSTLPKGFQNFIAVDVDEDGYDELICYSSALKKIGIFTPSTTDENELKEFQINSELSQVRQLNGNADSTKLFVALKRKLRKISLLSISLNAIDENAGEITFDSFPEKIYTADIDLNGTDEILVCGSGFNGLSVLYRSGRDFGEKKIITETSFSDAIFIDFNSDGYLDVLAFNILENSLQFFFNNTSGDFRLRRSIQYPEKIDLLKTVDMDQDGFQDIVYSVNNRIEILFGDFQSSYEKKNTIRLNEKPIQIQFGDFNKDNIIDMTYLVYQEKLCILFGKDGDSFYEEITYLQSSSISFFTKLFYENSESLACLFESGDLKIITTLSEYDNDPKIVPSIQAGAVKKFDYLKNDVPDISFIDEYDNSLKLFLNDDKGIPSAFYSFPLVDNHKEILVDEFFKRRKIFYCYTKGTPLLEVIRYNFYTNVINRKQLYAPGEILDVALQRIDSTIVNVFLLYNKDSKLYLGKFENRDLSVTFREYPFIDRNVSLAGLFINDHPEIYYWKSEEASTQFKLAEVVSGPNIYKTFLEVPKSDSLSISLYSADIYYNDYPSLISLIQSKTNNYLLVLSGNKIITNTTLFNSPIKYIKKFARGYFGGTSIKGIISFTVKAMDDAYIYKLVFNEKEKAFTLRKMLDANDVSDYFFGRLDQKNYYLVYSNKKEGCLSILSLKK